MTQRTTEPPNPASLNEEEKQSVLFAQMVMEFSNMAFMLMGRVPHPETKESVRDLESARMFIDQLEMLQVKTKGNLRKEEDTLLKQTLMTLRMAFVEALESPEPAAQKPSPAVPEAAPETKTAPGVEAGAGEDAKTKFSKKYSL